MSLSPQRAANLAENPNAGQGAVVLDIGDGRGAIIAHLSAADEGAEVEIESLDGAASEAELVELHAHEHAPAPAHEHPHEHEHEHEHQHEHAHDEPVAPARTSPCSAAHSVGRGHLQRRLPLAARRHLPPPRARQRPLARGRGHRRDGHRGRLERPHP